ncbi:MAG: dihydrolipoamide acetyltransferase family protein [Acidimicrobiia bacterium]
MAFEFHLPDIGEGLAEATIVSWRVPVGGTVGLDEPLVEVETDKAVVEIPSPRAGVVLHHGAPEGVTLAVEALLVVIGEPGESWSPAEEASPAQPEPASATPRPAAPIVGTLEEASETVGEARTEGILALPLVRRLAFELGVDLDTVEGTGPGGRITREDVEQAMAGGGLVDRVRLSATRLAIARNLTRSWQEIPHVTTYAAANATGLLAERSRLAAGRVLPLEALLISSLVPLLREFPEFNASLDGEYVLYRRHYDIGFAVDTPDGLMVAVVREADDRTVGEIADEVLRLAEAARQRRATPAELRGATFTVSNIGAVGGGYGTPIIPYGTTAILSVGRAEPVPVESDGAITLRRQLPLSLSYDHRLIDGALGRRFLGSIVEAIESRG